MKVVTLKKKKTEKCRKYAGMLYGETKYFFNGEIPTFPLCTRTLGGACNKKKIGQNEYMEEKKQL